MITPSGRKVTRRREESKNYFEIIKHGVPAHGVCLHAVGAWCLMPGSNQSSVVNQSSSYTWFYICYNLLHLSDARWFNVGKEIIMFYNIGLKHNLKNGIVTAQLNLNWSWS